MFWFVLLIFMIIYILIYKNFKYFLMNKYKDIVKKNNEKRCENEKFYKDLGEIFGDEDVEFHNCNQRDNIVNNTIIFIHSKNTNFKNKDDISIKRYKIINFCINLLMLLFGIFVLSSIINMHTNIFNDSIFYMIFSGRYKLIFLILVFIIIIINYINKTILTDKKPKIFKVVLLYFMFIIILGIGIPKDNFILFILILSSNIANILNSIKIKKVGI